MRLKADFRTLLYPSSTCESAGGVNSPAVPAAVRSGGPAVLAASSITTRQYPRSSRSGIEAQKFLRPLRRDPDVPAVVPFTYAQRYLRRRENARRLELALPQKYLLAERARNWGAGEVPHRCPERTGSLRLARLPL